MRDPSRAVNPQHMLTRIDVCVAAWHLASNAEYFKSSRVKGNQIKVNRKQVTNAFLKYVIIKKLFPRGNDAGRMRGC